MTPLGQSHAGRASTFLVCPLGQGRDRAGAFTPKFEAGRIFFHVFALVALIRREKH